MKVNAEIKFLAGLKAHFLENIERDIEREREREKAGESSSKQSVNAKMMTGQGLIPVSV